MNPSVGVVGTGFKNIAAGGADREKLLAPAAKMRMLLAGCHRLRNSQRVLKRVLGTGNLAERDGEGPLFQNPAALKTWARMAFSPGSAAADDIGPDGNPRPNVVPPTSRPATPARRAKRPIGSADSTTITRA